MYFKRDKMWVIVLIITLYPGKSASSSSKEKLNLKNALSSEATPIFGQGSKELGNRCLALPKVGDAEFRTLVEQNCYVDKTDYLYKIIQEGHKNWFLSRPRRFGKTLLIDTMVAFFTGQKQLFKDTAIYQHFEKSFAFVKYISDWPTYPTLRFDFTDVFTVTSHADFANALLWLLKRMAKEHNIDLDADFVGGAISNLIELLSKKHKSKIVVLIDEYDSQYTKMFAHNRVEAAKILRTMQDFFGILKAKYMYIRLCFVTGVSRVALSDFFSGFNAAVDITMNPNYAGIVGFNETELHEYFGGHIKATAKATGKTEKEVLEKMRIWHDGFQFTVKNESLYSPCSVIGYLGSEGSTKSWSGTGGPSQFLVSRLKEFPQEALEVLIGDEFNGQADKSKKRQYIKASDAELTGKINFENMTDPAALVAILFHNGYLRIVNYDNTTETFSLEFTNLELKKDYTERLYQSLTNSPPKRMGELIDLLVEDLDKHQWKPFIKKLNSFFSRIPYHLLTNQKRGLEAWFQFTMYLMFDFSTYARAHPIELTWEDSTNKGRSDLTIPIGDTIFIFEPKMDENPENPLYECKEKSLHKYLFGSKIFVVCFGVRFFPTGVVSSWGAAKFSKNGTLLQEDGDIKLTTRLSVEETKKITDKLNDFKSNHPTFTLHPDKLIELLQKLGPTTTDERVFVTKFTEDFENVRILLKKIKPLLDRNFKGILFSLLKRLKKYEFKTTTTKCY